VIQAGGQSSRMGTTKGLLQFSGEPLIQRVISRVIGVSTDIWVVTPSPEEYPFLKVKFTQDAMPFGGPLVGLQTGLEAAEGNLVAMVACDMPFVDAALLEAMFVRAESGDWDVVIPVADHRMEPLCAVYRKDACLAAARQALADGERRVVSILPGLNAYSVEHAELTQFGNPQIMFMNINTPDEFARAEQLDRAMTAG